MISQSKKAKRPSLLREFSKSKSGLIGLAILIILFSLTAYSLATLPQSFNYQWDNGAAWLLNPVNAPPAWFSYFSSSLSPTLDLSMNNWNQVVFNAGSFNIYEYTDTVTFSWTSTSFPQNIAFVPSFTGHATTASVNWTKPSNGGSILMTIPNPNPGQAFETQSSYIASGAEQFLLKETGQFYSGLTTPQIIAALFGQSGPKILNSSVVKGTYSITVQITSEQALTSISKSIFVVIGNAYGTMGTDYQGKPIDLGLLAGLPNALEIGFLVAIVSVVAGIIFGGLSGYFGAKKDGIMQWVTLVVLAMPALPFLVAMSYSVKLDILIEVLLIAALSWPFYAIIARTVALSVKSQTFVEADKAMGVPSHRVFFSHFMPRLVPVTVAYTVLGIPGGILLAETLAFIGIAPPDLVTWGKILDDAFINQAAVYGFWWWVLFPGLMIIVSAIPFVLIGFALERVIAPRVAAK